MLTGIEMDLHIQARSLPEHRLLSAVIVTAMRDACTPPVTDWSKKTIRMAHHAITAHDFLWLDGLESYLHYLDIEPHYFRKALLKTMANDTAMKIGEFTPENRRAFRANKKKWDSLYTGNGPVTQSWSDDE